jgi:trigger factor
LNRRSKNASKKLARTARINGFRTGKIPLRVVEQKFGGQIRHEVISEVVQSSFQEAIQQENLYLAGEPTFDIKSDLKSLEQGFSYTAVFNVYPETGHLKIEDLNIEKPVAEVTEADIDTILERLRQQAQTWQEVDEPAELNMRVIIDYMGSVDEQPFPDNEAKQLPVILAQDQDKATLPLDFINNLLGARAGEQRAFEVTFPQAYQNAEFAGKTIHFSVQIHSVARAKIPDMDAEFAKSLGIADGNLDTLRQDARANMERELEQVIKNKLKQQVLDALLAANPIEAPAALVDEEKQRLLNNRQHYFSAQQKQTDLFETEATKRVKLGLLVGELVRTHHIQAQPEKIREMVEKIASTYETPKDVVAWYYADRQRLNEIRSMVLEDQVVAWLLDKSQLTEVKTDFYALMESRQTQGPSN